MQVDNNNLNISDQNYKILEGQAKKILDKHLNFAAPEPGWFETILSYIPLPSLSSIGSTLGRAGAISHGPQLTDYAITKLTPKLFPEVGGKYGAAMLAEAARLSLNPYLLPIVTSVCTSGGGLCLQGAAVIVQWLFSRTLSNKKTHYSMNNLPSLDQLIKVSQDGKLIDANGDEISMEDIRQITKWVSRFNLICRLMEAKRGCIPNIAAKYVKTIDGRMTYLNGEEVSEKHLKILRIALDCLQSKNMTNSTKEIKKAVCLLADNSFSEEALVLQNKVENKPEERVEIVEEDKVEELLKDWCMIQVTVEEVTNLKIFENNEE